MYYRLNRFILCKLMAHIEQLLNKNPFISTVGMGPTLKVQRKIDDLAR